MKKFKLLFASLAIATLGLSACSASLPSIFDTGDVSAKYVTEVTLDNSYFSLEIGSKVTLTPTVKMMEGHENDEYKSFWRSSRPNVAKVENGEITTLAAGTASISFVAGLKMATCTVVVHGGSENPTYDEDQASTVTISISVSSKTLTVNDEFQIVASASDGSQLTWTSSDESVATVSSSGVVNALAAGNTTIRVSSGTIYKTCEITVTDGSIIPDPEEEDDDKSVTVYFFIDYNNIDERDTTGTKLLATFKWYENVPLSKSGLVPANPTTPKDPAFPNFIGWSSHTIIDSSDDLWDIENDLIGSEHFFYLYGIWVADGDPAGGF